MVACAKVTVVPVTVKLSSIKSNNILLFEEVLPTNNNINNSLCEIMSKNGSDKGGKNNRHNYTKIYTELFKSLINKNIKEIEVELLKKYSNQLNFEVEEINEQIVDGEIVSSTHIRNYLLERDIQKANSLLGYAYFFEGFIVRGNQIGRTIGFPTANLHINDEEKLIPANGVYAVKVTGACLAHQIYNGMMNIGVRPTVDGQKKVIEVNIFHFDADIYENNITVFVYDYIRGEVKFEGLEGLKAQLNQDKVTAANLLKQYP